MIASTAVEQPHLSRVLRSNNKLNTVNQFNLAAIKVSVLKSVNIRH